MAAPGEGEEGKEGQMVGRSEGQPGGQTSPANQTNPARAGLLTEPADICFDDVWFAYPSPQQQSWQLAEKLPTHEHDQRPALRGLSFLAPHGQTVALVGATGAGKSTVASLLLRFVAPDAGQITVGGAQLDSIDRAAWRRQVAFVPQLPHLFHGTVLDNIRLAQPNAGPRSGPEASLEQVIAAAQAAHAHEFIQALPQGYDTPLGEGGARLSGGQRQRLALARAFLKDAPVLLLDEATASLDARSEALIRDALARLMAGRTVLLIAHRLELAYSADQIVVMEAGRAAETGTHATLLAKGGLYSQLVASYGE
jgi:ATP-binding cassette, subfamily C, bacterial CydD